MTFLSILDDGGKCAERALLLCRGLNQFFSRSVTFSSWNLAPTELGPDSLNLWYWKPLGSVRDLCIPDLLIVACGMLSSSESSRTNLALEGASVEEFEASEEDEEWEPRNLEWSSRMT